MEKYSKAKAIVEEAVNTKITKIELEIEPTLYKDAPREKDSKNKSLPKSDKNLKSTETQSTTKRQTILPIFISLLCAVAIFVEFKIQHPKTATFDEQKSVISNFFDKS